MKKAFIGIDGGGSHTRALAIDSKGRNLSINTVAGCNPHNIGFQQSGGRIDEVVTLTCQSLPKEGIEIASVFCGIAGIRSEDEKAALAKSLSRFTWAQSVKVHIDSDLAIAYEAALGDRIGICLIAGTGAACIAKNSSGQFHTLSNRQANGDEPGSGYGIGKDALQAGLLPEIEDVSRDAVSKLAQSVVDLAGNGNTEAIEILDSNAQSLAQLVDRVHTLANLGAAFPIALTGGLASAETEFRALTTQKISSLFPQSEQLRSRLAPVEAAARLAMRQWRNHNPRHEAR